MINVVFTRMYLRAECTRIRAYEGARIVIQHMLNTVGKSDKMHTTLTFHGTVIVLRN